MKQTVCIAGAVLLTIMSGTSQAETVVEALQTCRDEANDLKRLICFDNLAESMNIYAGTSQSVDDVADSRPTQQVASVAAGAASATPDTAAAPASSSTFGMEVRTEDLQQKMSATITDVTLSPRNDFIITLDNGMVWRQNGKAANYNLNVGDNISIERGFMSAFYLSKEGRNARVNVRRIK